MLTDCPEAGVKASAIAPLYSAEFAAYRGGMKRTELAELRGLIDQRLTQLARDLAHAEAASDEIVLDEDPGRVARMGAIQDKAMAEATEARHRAEMGRLEDARRRIERDPKNFGICVECGEPIPLARLRIDPSTRRCAECGRRS
jgi:DnaK suppressor protein